LSKIVGVLCKKNLYI